jgi:hypothetical protein
MTSENPAVYGAFDEYGHTTPTATRMEGLLAALTFLPEDDADLRRDVLRSVRQGMTFLIAAQVQDGKWAGALPRTYAPSEAVGDRATELRIDYAQHLLSALMQYEQVVLGRR